MVLQAKNDPLANKLEYNNTQRHFILILPNVLESFKLLIPTDVIEYCLY